MDSKNFNYHCDDTIDALTYTYGVNDIIATNIAVDSLYHYVTISSDGIKFESKLNKPNMKLSDIKKVIFHDPATIICWADGTKTVVKCHKDDIYDKDKGFLLCICKKFFGDDFHKVLKEYGMEKEATISFYHIDAKFYDDHWSKLSDLTV